MSQTGFTIYEDQENRVPGLNLRNKRDQLRNVGAKNGQTRTALGVLSSNQTENIRKQPSRTAKQTVNYANSYSSNSQDENSYAKPKSVCDDDPITIYSDETKSQVTISTTSSFTTNQSSVLSEKPSNVDKSSLQFAASKLEVSLPNCITNLPRVNNLASQNEEMMDYSITDEGSVSMSVATPTRTQEHLLRKREEQMYDMVEYASDIYAYLREAEKIHRPRINYMVKQTDISINMRWILVDWMVEVSEEYNLSTETLYLAVSYIDRFLSHMSVKRDKLQLVGTTAMFIAAKYEEIYPPDVAQFAYITDNTYRVSHILRMEHLILKVLSFDMAVPTAFGFINKFSRTLGCTEVTTSLALFIAELTMLDSDPFLRFLPSEIAATALCIANFTQGHTPWPSVMTETYGYSLEDLKECYVNMNRAFGGVNEAQQHAIREKYKHSKNHGVSSIKARSELPF